MAAPERFAEMSDSSCTAGAVHTWHFSDLTASSNVRFAPTAVVVVRQSIVMEFRPPAVTDPVASSALIQ
jgi:hypothetical protein